MIQPGVGTHDLDRLVQALPTSDWQSLSGCHLLVTGGTGFLGSWLLELLLHADQRFGLSLRVSVLSRRPSAFAQSRPHLALHPAVRLIAGDVREVQHLSVRCDALIHAGADAAHISSDAVGTFDAMLEGTRQVLALAQRSGCRRVLNLSSGAVYGAQPPNVLRMPESQPTALANGHPQAAYGLGKLASEWLADQLAERAQIHVTHARPFAVVGAYIPLQGRYAAGQFLADVAAARSVQVASHGAALRSYLYAGDAAVWLLAILLRGGHRAAYNVGSEESVSILELARRLAQMGGVGVSVADPNPPPADPNRYVPDTALARESLGLKTYTPLANALALSLEWVRTCARAEAQA